MNSRIVLATAIGSTAVAACAAIALRAAWIAARGYRLQGARVAPPSLGPFASAQAVEFALREGPTVRGWLVPSSNGAGVVLVHPGPDWTELLPEANILATAGYGVIVFDLPGRGASDPPVSWHSNRCDSISAAVTRLAAEPTIDARRIGAFGYSCGSALVAEVAAHDQRIRAAILAAGFADIDAQIRQDFGRWGPLSQVPAILMSRRLRKGGPDALRPLVHISRIAPRPLLIIGTEHDVGVPPGSAHALYDAAGQPKELLLFPGTAHGHFSSSFNDEYSRQLVAFFDAHLTV